MNRSDWTSGDENVARLLGQAYNPPIVPADFAARMHARLQSVAAETAQQREAAPRWSPIFNRRLAALAGVAALLGIVALGLRFTPHPAAPSSVHPILRDHPMVAAPSPTPKRAPRLLPGETLATRAGQRCRVTLPDDSVLSINQNTAIHYDTLRHLTLKAGEIFIEAAPQLAAHASSLFTVATPHRVIRATDTKFLVRADAEGTGVAVAQGQVHVSDWDGLLSAGQQLAPKTDAVTPTPRLSYMLDWTRDLVVSATPSLVPANAYNGGALVAVDSQDHTAPLTLRKYHIDVHIEDGFARTTIDQTYFNHTPNRLEGTFYFPLPADASLSRLAMYVNGDLMEGGMVQREYGRTVFEQIVTKMKDPALLEWVDGRTFKMRVFPLEGRQEKRIVLSYTQRLPNLYGRLSYRSPAGHSLGAVRDWSFHARVKNGATTDWHCDSHRLTPRVENGDLLLDARAHQAAMERDIVLELRDRAGASSVRYSTAEQDGYRYLMLRYRPDLPGTTQRQRRDWVFLFESSADRDPLLARTQVEVIRTLLSNAESDDTFAVLTVNTQVQRFAAAPQRVTPENIAAALAFLDQAHLLGALDLDAGLTAAAELLHTSRNPVLVHLGSGQAVLGERGAEALANRIPREASYVGVAVGKQWAQDFMQRATDRCQGYVTEINPDEPVAWRSFDLLATLNTPRLLGVCVTDSAGKANFLSGSTMLAQGEELCAIARLPVGVPLPKSLRITGTLDGRAFQSELPVESPRSGAAYLPRTWARLEIDRLLAEDTQKNKGAIIALSKAMYVMTPYTSLLVLENEAMYAQYKVDRGRKDHWAMYPCPPKIPVVCEALPQDWRLSFDPITGQPLNPLNDSLFLGDLNQENNQLGFYPPAQALAVKASSTIHSRGYNIQLEPPGLERLAQSMQPDVQLKERIRQENRERPAAVIAANAQYQLTIAQAQLVREEARRSQIQTRRAWIEEAEYERAHMPDPEKIRQQQLPRELDRARVSPPLTEIWSGRSLNVLLYHLIAQQGQDVHGPIVPLREATLKSINLTARDGRGSLGLLIKDNGNLQWPQPLQGEAFKEAREDFSGRLKHAVKQLQLNRRPDESAMKRLSEDLKKLNDTLEAKVSTMSPDTYIEAKRYLRLLANTIAALKDRNAPNYFNGKLTAKSKNVAELLKFMADKGLWFAPTTPGDEPAYLALYQALTAFDAGIVRQPLFQLDAYASPAADSPNPDSAERLLTALLSDPRQAKQPAMWRRAARVAEQRKHYDIARQRLERALALEAKQPRDLPALRRDYAWLLRLAHKRANALIALRRPMPRELLDQVMSVADHWRTVDPVDWISCYLAARILRLAGERELAWAYSTTPLALHGASAANWLEVARQQHWQNDFDFAERAFAVAASLEPANAEIARERTLNRRAAQRAPQERRH